MGHPIGRMLGMVHLLVVFLTQMKVCVVGHQQGEGVGRLHDMPCVLVEHLEKIALTGQQLAKQHGDS